MYRLLVITDPDKNVRVNCTLHIARSTYEIHIEYKSWLLHNVIIIIFRYQRRAKHEILYLHSGNCLQRKNNKSIIISFYLNTLSRRWFRRIKTVYRVWHYVYIFHILNIYPAYMVNTTSSSRIYINICMHINIYMFTNNKLLS